MKRIETQGNSVRFTQNVANSKRLMVACFVWVGLLATFGYASQIGAADSVVIEQGNQIAKQISTWDWLGPLAPIALSPFFGLACLSGVACYGPDWLQERSGLLGDSSPLHNEVLCWVMVGLTVLTSLPRLTKVSKPLALAAEKLETYSVVVIFLSMRLLAQESSSAPEAGIQVALAGFNPFTVPMDLAMALAAGLNIVVINTIKLFVEFLVWLIPFPFVDAGLEAFNKSASACLMGLYLYSPLLATLVNLCILAVCSFVFFKVVRRIRLYKHLIIGPVLGWYFPSRYGESEDSFNCFLDESIQGFPRYSQWKATRTKESGWELNRVSWWNKKTISLGPCDPIVEKGWIRELVTLPSDKQERWKLVRRVNLANGFIPVPTGTS